jgi:hypothetical protein
MFGIVFWQIENGGNIDAVKTTLQEIARECATEGTQCNNWLTGR